MEIDMETKHVEMKDTKPAYAAEMDAGSDVAQHEVVKFAELLAERAKIISTVAPGSAIFANAMVLHSVEVLLATAISGLYYDDAPETYMEEVKDLMRSRIEYVLENGVTIADEVAARKRGLGHVHDI